MSSRTSQKAAARRARLEAQKRANLQQARQKRFRSLLGVILIAAVLVAVSVAVSSGSGAAANAANGGRLVGTALSRNLFSGIPQSGTTLGSTRAPVRLVEFADLQCPYCDEYAVQALPTLVKDYVRTGKVQMRFENLSFIGPGSVAAGKVAAGASQQNKLWNFIDLMYLNQGKENSGYVTPAYLQRLLQAVPSVNVRDALDSSRSPVASAELSSANQAAAQYGISATPTFLIGAAGGPLHQFQPSSLSPAPFETEINGLLRGAK
jgi:protein-disulfide isomerase